MQSIIRLVDNLIWHFFKSARTANILYNPISVTDLQNDYVVIILSLNITITINYFYIYTYIAIYF